MLEPRQEQDEETDESSVLGDGEHSSGEGSYTAIIFNEEMQPREVSYSIIEGQAVEDGDVDLGPLEDVQRATQVARLLALSSILPEPRDATDAVRSGDRVPIAELRALLDEQRMLFFLESMRQLQVDKLPDQMRALFEPALRALPNQDNPAAVRSILGTAVQGRRWPGAVVPYEIDGVSDAQVRGALDYWQDKTPVVFRERQGRDGNYLRIVLSTSWCSSWVGMSGGPQRVRITRGCGKGGLAHELGHAIGLHHEQKRTDRDQYVRINYNNIRAGKAGNFDIERRSVNHGTSYDYGSLMHYGLYAFARNRRIKTIIPLRPYDGVIGQRRALSASDIATVTRRYSQ